MIGQVPAPGWLATEALLAQFGADRAEAIRRYAWFVAEGISREGIWKDLNRQVFLGDDRFVSRMQAKHKGALEDINIPKAQQRPPRLWKRSLHFREAGTLR